MGQQSTVVSIVGNYDFTLSGLPDLIQAIEQSKDLTDVKEAVKYHTANMARYALRNVPVKTGFLKRSEMLAIEEAGLAGRVSFYAEYAPYQEYGTRWIYGKFFLKKAFDQANKEFIVDLERMFK